MHREVEAVAFITTPEPPSMVLDEILFDSRENAEYVLDKLIGMVYDYGKVTVYDLYHFIGCANIPENSTYGWTDLSSARIIVTGGERWFRGVQKRYRLHLPEVISLSKTMVDAKEKSKTDDNNAILKLLGTEYSMVVRRDIEAMEYTVRVSDSQDRHFSISFSELEMIHTNSNVLLHHIEQCILALKDGQSSDTTSWIYWSGWSGNHDKRIEDAKCLKCGYIHPTVYGSLDNLSKYCPGCGRKIKEKC